MPIRVPVAFHPSLCFLLWCSSVHDLLIFYRDMAKGGRHYYRRHFSLVPVHHCHFLYFGFPSNVLCSISGHFRPSSPQQLLTKRPNKSDGGSREREKWRRKWAPIPQHSRSSTRINIGNDSDGVIQSKLSGKTPIFGANYSATLSLNRDDPRRSWLSDWKIFLFSRSWIRNFISLRAYFAHSSMFSHLIHIWAGMICFGLRFPMTPNQIQLIPV